MKFLTTLSLIFLSCLFVVFIVLFVQSKSNATNGFAPIKNDSLKLGVLLKYKSDSLQIATALIDLKEKNSVLTEQLNSINTRFNDLYILGGIIITLLLAINVSVYVKASNEVKIHLDKKFGKQTEKINEYLAKAQSLLGTIQGIEEMSKATLKSKQEEKEKIQVPK